LSCAVTVLMRTMASEEKEDDKFRELERKIGELRTSEKELFHELERISKHKRQCVDELHRLTAEKLDRVKQQQGVQRLIELEAEMKRVKCENEALKREKETLKRTNSKCSVTINKLKQSLDEGVKNSRLQSRKITELNAKISALKQARATDIPVGSGNNNNVAELQEKFDLTNELLCKTKEELNETRQHLSEVQERLTVAEQLTSATQHRELQESDNSEQLQPELIPRHQPTLHIGLDLFFSQTKRIRQVSR